MTSCTPKCTFFPFTYMKYHNKVSGLVLFLYRFVAMHSVICLKFWTLALLCCCILLQCVYWNQSHLDNELSNQTSNILFQYTDNPEGRYRLSLHTGQVPHQARGGFSSMKQLGVLLLLPGWEVIHLTDTGPSIGQYNISPSTVNMSPEYQSTYQPKTDNSIGHYIGQQQLIKYINTSTDMLSNTRLLPWPTLCQPIPWLTCWLTSDRHLANTLQHQQVSKSKRLTFLDHVY